METVRPIKRKTKKQRDLVFSKQPKNLAETLDYALAWHVEHELPQKTRRPNKNGAECPLICWMQGASDRKSKVMQVTNGEVRYPFKNMISGLRFIADRIAKRYEITWAQHCFLMTHLLCHYGGREDRSSAFLGMYGDSNITYDRNAPDFILQSMKRLGIESLPLSAILCPNITNLILMFQYEIQFKKTFSRDRLKWK